MDEFERLSVLNNDGALLWTSRIYGFVGVLLLLGALGGPVYYLGVATQGDAGMPWPWAIGSASVACLGGGVSGLLHMVAASGLGKGAKYGWYLGVFLAIGYLPHCCFPFGALFLFALLRGKVRTAFFEKATA